MIQAIRPIRPIPTMWLPVFGWRGRWSETADFPRALIKGRVADMRFVTTLDRDEDGVWVAECPSIPGCVSQGETREQALSNIRDAIAACLAVRAQRGMPLTIETQEVEVVL